MCRYCEDEDRIAARRALAHALNVHPDVCDPYAARAASVFKKRVDEVTPAERAAVKEMFWKVTYSAVGVLSDGDIRAQLDRQTRKG